MEITRVRLYRVSGTLEHKGEFWEERLIRPVNIYPEHKAEGAVWLEPLGPGAYRNVAHFVEIETDQGVSGIGGPIPEELAYIIGKQLAPLLIGHDPLAIERLWDRMYRFQVHGRKGTPMMALSAVDCASVGSQGQVVRCAGLSIVGRTDPNRDPGLRQRAGLLA